MHDIQKKMLAIIDLHRIGVTVEERALLLAMATYAMIDGDIDKSPEELAKTVGWSVEEIDNTIISLIEKGLIVLIGDRDNHYIYELNIPALPEV